MHPMVFQAVVVWAMATGQTAPADRVAPVVRVMSFNIRYGKAADGENRWENRRDLVIEVIRRHQPDLVGLQEALRFQLDEMAKGLPEYREMGVGRDNGQDKGEYNTILYRADRFRPTEQGNFWYSDTPETPGSKTWGNRLPRLCTWSRFVAIEKAAGIPPFYYYNTHLDHESQRSRVKSAELLAQRIGFRTHKDPVIISGDFNVGENNPVITYLTGKTATTRPKGGDRRTVFVDTFRRLHPDAREVGTFNGFKGQTTGAKIDYILTSPDVVPIEAAILRDNDNGRYPSDHFPIMALVRLPERNRQEK